MDNSIAITKCEPKTKQGLIVIITGNGKGKTTSPWVWLYVAVVTD